MNKFRIGVVVTFVIASAAVCGVMRQRAAARAQRVEKARRSLAESVERLTADNERLSNLVTRMNSAEALSREQLGELLKLRHDVGQLRQAATEKTKLQKSNARLEAGAKEVARKLAEAQALPNYWPKEQLAYSGFGDPESALKTMLAAMNKGDYRSWQTMMTPEALANMQREMARRGISDEQIEMQVKEMGNALVSAAAGYHIVDETNLAPDKAVINLSFDGEGAERKFVLRKVGNEWKFQDLMMAGQ